MLVQRESEFSESLRAQENYFGFTPLHYAVLVDNVDCVRALLENGANPLIEACGHLPVHLTKNPAMQHLLKEYAITVGSLHLIFVHSNPYLVSGIIDYSVLSVNISDFMIVISFSLKKNRKLVKLKKGDGFLWNKDLNNTLLVKRQLLLLLHLVFKSLICFVLVVKL